MAISDKTPVNLGLVVSLVGTLVTGVAWGVSVKADAAQALDRVQRVEAAQEAARLRESDAHAAQVRLETRLDGIDSTLTSILAELRAARGVLSAKGHP